MLTPALGVVGERGQLPAGVGDRLDLVPRGLASEVVAFLELIPPPRRSGAAPGTVQCVAKFAGQVVG